MRRRMLPHQRRAFRQFCRSEVAALLMEMRLGKTLTAIRWLMTRPGVKRALIVAPIAAQMGWQDDAAKEGRTVHVLSGPMAKRVEYLERHWADGGWFLTNYQGLTIPGNRTASGRARVTPSPILRKEWDAGILDESPAVKNPTAQVTKAVLTFLQPRFRAILTGLPDPEGAQDYVCQMLWAFGEFMGCPDFWKWRQRHMTPGWAGGWEVKAKSVGLANAWVRDRCFVLSRKEAGMANRHIMEKRYVELPAKVNKALRHAEAWFEVPDAGLITSQRMVVLAWQLGMLGGRFNHLEALHHDAKFAELRRLCAGELRREPMIVYAARTAEVKDLAKMLDRMGGAVCVWGGLTKPERDQEIRRFQRGRVRYIVANPASVRMGVDLSRASAITHLSSTWSAETRAQAASRPEHPLKRESILEIDLVVKGEADEDVVTALADKRMNTVMAKKALLSALSRRKGEK